MSVENIDSETATGGFPEQTENMSATCKEKEKEEPSVSSEEEEEAIIMPTTVAPAVGVMRMAESAATAESKNSLPSDVMAWVDSMQDEELLRVFTIDDMPFLATLLALSPWSSLAANEQTDRPSGLSVGEYCNPRRHRSAVRESCIRVGVNVQRAFGWQG